MAIERERAARSTRVEHALALLRKALQDCEWTYEALAVHTGKDRSYLHAILNGERPCRLDFLATLPEDVRARYAELVAQEYAFVVVRPAAAESAAAHLVAGLLGLLKPQMAKAQLEPVNAKGQVA
jgi:hypothetical protein